MYNMYSLSSIATYTILLFSLFETALANECPWGLRLMFRVAKITLRIGFTRHFDQFHDCSTGRTFHTPAARIRARRARYKALFQRNCQVESSWAELNSRWQCRVLLYIFFAINSGRCPGRFQRIRVFHAANSRGIVTSFVLFSSAHRIGHLSGARIYTLA